LIFKQHSHCLGEEISDYLARYEVISEKAVDEKTKARRAASNMIAEHFLAGIRHIQVDGETMQDENLTKSKEKIISELWSLLRRFIEVF
jgi:hypothetical protein